MFVLQICNSLGGYLNLDVKHAFSNGRKDEKHVVSCDIYKHYKYIIQLYGQL